MYYVDRFSYELVTEKDSIAPPERYYEYIRGIDNSVIIESYIVSHNPLQKINFAYTVDELKFNIPGSREGFRYVEEKRKNFFKEHNVEHPTICAYTVPMNWFDEELKRRGILDEED